MRPAAKDNPAVRETLDAIRRIVHALRVSSRDAEKRTGLSGAQLFVLYKLADGCSASLNELAARTRTHQSSVSVVVQRLVDRKLVRREASAQDRRRLVLSMTPAGRALLRRAPAAAQEKLIAALERMPAPRLRQLAHSMQALLRGIGIEREIPHLFFEEKPRAANRRKRRTHGQS
ncbi:MAG: MarR family transcriptional regulator [Planctomycetes bacterium]|nr:MarR family transcriptional regulator [Planctomycetota bacterium]